METLSAMKNSIRKDALVISLAPKITIRKDQVLLPDVINMPVWIRMQERMLIKDIISLYMSVCRTKCCKEFLEHLMNWASSLSCGESDRGICNGQCKGHTYFCISCQQLKELGLSYGLSESEANETISAMLWGTTERFSIPDWIMKRSLTWFRWNQWRNMKTPSGSIIKRA